MKNCVNGTTKSCCNCGKRRYRDMFGWEYCIDYERACSDEECRKLAATCRQYEPQNEDEEDEERRYTSSTFRDYGPSNPWDAPGMSIRDFI